MGLVIEGLQAALQYNFSHIDDNSMCPQVAEAGYGEHSGLGLFLIV